MGAKIKSINKPLKRKKTLRLKIWNKGRQIKNNLKIDEQPRADFWIIIITLGLLVFGLLMVFSASYYAELSKGRSPYGFLVKNGAMITLGIIAMMVFSYVDYRVYRKWYKVIALVSVILLFALFTPLGVEINNAKRWLNLQVITIMPGEIAKIAMIIWASSILSKKNEDVNNLGTIVKIFGLTVIYVGLIMMQPNMSTAMTVAFIAVSIVFVAGLRTIYFTGTLGFLGVSIVFLILSGGGYRLNRYTSFLDPFEDVTGNSWQVVQSLLAIGSGGLLGKGPGGSVQKALYLPEAQTDFILAIIGEELGFRGICLMVIAYTVLVWRGLIIAMNAPDKFGTFMACGIVMMIGIQVLLNIAIVTSSMPATGIALPFVSYGGNATVIYCAAIGILLNIGKHKKNKTEDDFIAIN